LLEVFRCQVSAPLQQYIGEERVMSTLVVIGYEDQFKAEEVRLALMKMQKDYLIDLEDAVVAVKDFENLAVARR
jgi:hypothetical protein